MERNRFNELLATPAELFTAARNEWTSRYSEDQYRQWHPSKHDVTDTLKRRDKLVQMPVDPNDPGGPTRPMPVPVTRIVVPLQKLIVRRMTAFITGGSLSLQSQAKADTPEGRLLEAVNATWTNGKVDFRNSDIVTRLLSETEVAEIWYSRTDEATGTVQLRSKVYSPEKGYQLLPVFDASGDMIAFCMQYKIKGEDGKDQQRMDLYTKLQRLRFSQDAGTDWAILETLPLPYKKIPVVFYQIDETIWADVQTMMDRFEIVISNFCDTNDYNGSPILFAKGVIEGFSNKGETGKVIQGEQGAELGYVTWAQVPEAIKFEVELLLRMIYSGVQVPDISFEAMRALGALSGVAFDRLMIDSHLRAKSFHDGVYGEGVQRRINFLISAISQIPESNRETRNELDITPKFGLFSIHDDAERITNAKLANGGKPIMTQRQSVAYAGIADDPAATADELEAEAKSAALVTKATGENENNSAE